MSTEPNLATVQATIEGLDRFIRATFSDLQRQLDQVVGLPREVEGLKSELTGLRATLGKEVDRLDKRIDGVEEDDERGTDRLVQWVLVVATVLVGIGVIIVGVLQLTRGIVHA